MAQAYPLMPKATAVWLVDNTTLTFEQIAEFCGLHALEVQAIADGEVALNIVAQNPIINGELTQEELDRCVANTRAKLKISKSDLPQPKQRSKGPRYTPVTKRARKPDAIAYLVKEYPVLTDSQIARLVGTTKPTIQSIRDRTHPNMPNIKPESPVSLGFCKQDELDRALRRAERAADRAAKEAEKQHASATPAVKEADPAEAEPVTDVSVEPVETQSEPVKIVENSEEIAETGDETTEKAQGNGF